MSRNNAVTKLTWSLTLATYRRPEILQRCVILASKQTFPPLEIIVVDASDNWEQQARSLRQRLHFESSWDGRLEYLPAKVAGATSQRNQAVQLANADVLFVIDDDSLMYPTAAEKIMQVYEHDIHRSIAGVQPQLAMQPPDVRDDQMKSESAGSPRGNRNVMGYVNRRVKGEFYPPWQRQPQTPLPHIPFPLTRSPQFQGARMTVRRDALLACLFDEAIRINYHDDSEICWRLARCGALVELSEPLIYHAQAERPGLGQRRNFRTRAAWVLNHAYLCRKLFGNGARTRMHVYRYAWGTVFLDFLQGCSSADFSGSRGALYAARRVPKFFRGSQVDASNLLRSESESLIQK